MTAIAPVSSFKRWQPKKWKPLYTEIVALHAAGSSNTEIAEAKGITKQTVSNVLSTPQCALILRQIHDKLVERVGKSIEGNLAVAANKAAERVRTYIEDDKYFENAPGAVVDRSLRILRSTGKIKDDAPNVTSGNTFIGKQQNNIIMSAESAKEIADALTLSREVDALHGSPTKYLNAPTS